MPYSKASRVSGRTNDANMLRTASFSRADLFMVETLLFLHNSKYFSDLCQLTMCDGASVERPCNAKKPFDTVAYGPAGNGGSKGSGGAKWAGRTQSVRQRNVLSAGSYVR